MYRPKSDLWREKYMPFSKRRSKMHITPVIRLVPRRPELPMADSPVPEPRQIPEQAVPEPIQIPLPMQIPEPHVPEPIPIPEPMQIPEPHVPELIQIPEPMQIPEPHVPEPPI
ncbi:hypothetical protein TNCV_1535871 [Trichonephila clavipes]|nr:hypothetical protein TNCV_1535871 [Trichonephila clavipes]